MNFGQSDKIKFQQDVVNPKENWAMQGRVRTCHEMLNGLLKNWGLLSQVFCRHISLHGDVFRVCAVVTLLTVENGDSTLFKVKY